MIVWKPNDDDCLAALEDQNPWHSIRRVPSELAQPVRRPLAEILWRVLLHPPVQRHQIILGPRRVGKTTAMYQTVERLLHHDLRPRKYWWLRLDHPLFLQLNLGSLINEIIRVSRAEPSDPTFLFLDELTYADNWALWLKTIHDEHWPVRIVGTSSATAAIREQRTESGVGRWEEQYLAPYLFTEYLDLKNISTDLIAQETLSETLRVALETKQSIPDLSDTRRRFIITGGFPELLTRDESGDEQSDILRSQRILRSDAIEKAIYKDIPQAFAIQDPAKLERLLYTLAGQVTGLFSPQTIGTDIQLASNTLERYVTFLERAFIVFTLSNYSPSEESVQRRGKKLYFIDGAVRNAALLRGLAPLSDPKEMGLLIENMVAAHLNALSHQTGVRLYHWRHKGHEVDFVYDHPSDPIAVEVTSSSSHSAKGISEFQRRFPRFEGRCFLVYPDAKPVLPNDQKPGRIPLDMLLVAIGKQSQHALERRFGVKHSPSTGQYMLFDED